MTSGSCEGTVLPTKFSPLMVTAFARSEVGLLTILLVLEIAQTRIELGPTASMRYSVPLAAVTKGTPGAGMLGCTTKSLAPKKNLT
jgi:hypothetical protein